MKSGMDNLYDLVYLCKKIGGVSFSMSYYESDDTYSFEVRTHDGKVFTGKNRPFVVAYKEAEEWLEEGL